MRGTRVRKLKAIFSELVTRKLVSKGKSNWMFMKKLYKRGTLSEFLPTM